MKKPKVRNPKIRWKGVFNFKHQVHILYCFATTEQAAWRNMCHQLSKKHGVAVWHTMNLFRGQEDNYTIEEVKDDQVKTENK